jgi:hypothetical protein
LSQDNFYSTSSATAWLLLALPPFILHSSFFFFYASVVVEINLELPFQAPPPYPPTYSKTTQESSQSFYLMSARARATFLPSELCWQAAEPADFNLSSATAAFFIFNLRRRGKSRRASSKVALAPALIGKLKERRVWCQRRFLQLESSVWG